MLITVRAQRVKLTAVMCNELTYYSIKFNENNIRAAGSMLATKDF